MSSVLIVLIVFSFVTFIVKMGLDHDRGNQKLSASADKSLTTSELRGLIRESVREANTEIVGRIERMENRIDDVERSQLLGPDDKSPRQLDAPGGETRPHHD